MKSPKRVIFVPGFSGIDEGGWPAWLGQELIKAGFDFTLLDMPDIMYPEVHQWNDFLKAQKIKVNRNTYFVGHSLGCITIASYLEGLSPRAVAGACIFVAGFCSLPKVPLLADFCLLPLDFSEVKKHAEEFVMIVSDNDRLIPNTDSHELAQKLGAEIIMEHGKGHFKADVKELHSVLNIILEIDQMQEEKKEIKRLKKK